MFSEGCRLAHTRICIPVIAIAEITPIVKARIRVVFILVFDAGSQLLQRHITARDIIPSPSSVKAGTCRARKLSLLLSRDVQATVL